MCANFSIYSRYLRVLEGGGGGGGGVNGCCFVELQR